MGGWGVSETAVYLTFSPWKGCSAGADGERYIHETMVWNIGITPHHGGDCPDGKGEMEIHFIIILIIFSSLCYHVFKAPSFDRNPIKTTLGPDWVRSEAGGATL